MQFLKVEKNPPLQIDMRKITLKKGIYGERNLIHNKRNTKKKSKSIMWFLKAERKEFASTNRYMNKRTLKKSTTKGT